MADLKTNELPVRPGRIPGEDADGASGGAGRSGRIGVLKRTYDRVVTQASPSALWRNHRLFTILALLSLLPRILAALAFRPALLTADSFLYMKNAVDGQLGYLRPSGYSAFLAIFRGLPHNLLVVTTLQHLMGVAMGIIVYCVLRYYGLPGWGASLAAIPVLFDARVIALESYILSDTLFCLVIVIAAAILLTKRKPSATQCVIAALLLSYACVLRGNGIPLAVIAAAFLLIRRVGWKRFTAASVAFVIPVLGYLLAFHHEYGMFNEDSSDGIFLWSRTTSFANCAIIKPPADLKPLCPNLEKSMQTGPTPAWSVAALLDRRMPTEYLWASDVWWRHDGHTYDNGINTYNNKLGEKFAVKAIEAQPLSYLRVAARDLALTFTATDRPQGGLYMTFTPGPRIPVLPSYYKNYIRAYAGTTSNTYAAHPWSYFMLLYQQPVIFPGLVYLLVLAAGLVGMIWNWRRWGGMQFLPWGLAAALIVFPALLTQPLYRYVIAAIPLACIAAGLTFAQRMPRNRAVLTAGMGTVALDPSPAQDPGGPAEPTARTPVAPAASAPVFPTPATPATPAAPAAPAAEASGEKTAEAAKPPWESTQGQES